MRSIFTRKLLLVSFIICTAVLSLLALSKKLYALEKNVRYGGGKDTRTELPWETMAHQFVGSVLFK